MLFLSDIHFDKNYTVGLNAECGEPLCCRPPNGPPRESACTHTATLVPRATIISLQISHCGVAVAAGKRAAGPWGDYNCDCPLQTLENLLQHVGNMSSEVCQGTAQLCVLCGSLPIAFCVWMQFDWVYVTGDLPPHNVWNQTREDQVRVAHRRRDRCGICAFTYSFAIIFPAPLHLPSPPLHSFMF